MSSSNQVRHDFDQIAKLPPTRWNANSHYHSYLLKQVPDNSERILDVGCGKGTFCHKLISKSQEIIGLDLSAIMISEGQKNMLHPKFTFQVNDYMHQYYPDNHFDAIVCIATLHHLPLPKFLVKAKRELKPGGKLVVLDLYQSKTIRDLICSLVAALVSTFYRLFYNGRLIGTATERKLWSNHGRHDDYLTLKELRITYGQMLEKARLKRHLLWRYSVVWRK